MICQCYKDEDEQNQEELVRGLSRDYMLWARQAVDLMYSFKNIEIFAKIAPFLMNKIADRHNRFAMVSNFPKSQRTLLTKVAQKMGRAYNFNYWNPNGHYELNRANEVERDVAATLFIMNKEMGKRIAAGERADRSQMGNKSCFRNEKFNTKSYELELLWMCHKLILHQLVGAVQINWVLI
jgi:hypothetical protein